MASPAARAWLEALGLAPRLPDGRFLGDAFLRFQRRVACETLTRPAGAPERFDPEAFAAEWPEEERGLAGGERALAFAWLAGELGFSCELVDSLCSRPWEAIARDELRPGEGDGGFSSKVNEPVAHRSVVARVEGRRILADAGFPLPCLVPLEPPFEEIVSSVGTLSVTEATGGERRVACEARGDVAELLRIAPHAGRSPLSLPLEEIRRPSPDASPLHGARGSKPPFALRLLDDRIHYWAEGSMTILDAWSLLTYPLAGSERAALEVLFALNLEGVDLPDVPASEGPASLTVFHALPLAPEEARRAVALSEKPVAAAVSRVVVVSPSVSGSRLASRAVLAGPVPPQGPAESVRKTLVFELAMELLGAGPASEER